MVGWHLLGLSMVWTLSLASPAAESAWVLWIEQGFPENMGTFVFATYKSADECISEIDQRDRQFRLVNEAWERLHPREASADLGPIVMYRGASTSLSTINTDRGKYPQANFIMNFLCLPDTVDPRGPKGK